MARKKKVIEEITAEEIIKQYEGKEPQMPQDEGEDLETVEEKED